MNNNQNQNQMQQQQQQVPPMPQAPAQNQAVAVFGNEKGAITYKVGGQDVKLSYSIVRNYLTKGNPNVPDQDVVQFMQICRYNSLNPFLGEAYLVKYGDSPAQMIVSKEALLKRAEANEHYAGYKAGIIVRRGDNIEYIEGAFRLPEDLLLGGWAEVYRDDRKVPAKAAVSFSEYSKNQSTWKSMPCTMIRKVALAQALREAFPIQLGAMYTAEEKGVPEDVPYEDVTDKVKQEIEREANGEVIGITEQPAEQPQQQAPAATGRRTAKQQAQQPQPQPQQTPFD